MLATQHAISVWNARAVLSERPAITWPFAL
jgi:hypothetical protein